MRFPTTQSGFSLIEMLVYIALLLVITVAGVSTMLSFNEQIVQLRLHRLVTETANVALERIGRETLSSETVDLTMSILNDRIGALGLTRTSGDITFTRVGTRIDFTDEAGDTVPITDDGVAVTGFWVYRYDVGVTEFVRVALEVTATSSGRSVAETFYSGIVLRGSYD